MQVKRERSPSPSLAPRLVTEGCVRIAPLPPECRNRQPNFQGARQQLAAAEMKKLRALGLQITRVFTREDGMVIDWYVLYLLRILGLRLGADSGFV